MFPVTTRITVRSATPSIPEVYPLPFVLATGSKKVTRNRNKSVTERKIKEFKNGSSSYN